MSEYMFGVSRVRLSRGEARRANAIAERHGAYLVESTIPGTGYQRWFCARNLGDPFNRATSLAVASDLEAAHID